MSQRQITMLIGVWVMVFLFLGFLMVWEQVIAVVTGLILIVMAYRSAPHEETATTSSVPFIEHKSELTVSEPLQSAPPVQESIPNTPDHSETA